MNYSYLRSFAISFFVVAVFAVGYYVHADTYKCDTPEEKAACTAQLNQTQQEIDSLGSQLSDIKQQGASLERDKAILSLQIKQAQLKIKAHELSIANLGKDIIAKQNQIKTLDQKINDGQDSLAQIMRKTNELDDYSLPEVMLGSQNLGEAFADLDAFDSVKSSLATIFAALRNDKKQNEDAKNELDQKRNQEIDTKANIEADKKKVQVAESEKTRLLNMNKSQQSNYQKIIADKQAKVAQIKAALFKIAGCGGPIQFGDAYKYAKEAGGATGVDPAFILAILTQESNLGSNVGKCYLTDTDTGAGVSSTGKTFPNVMKPTRDVKPFLDIVSSLGFDYTKTVVSCPIAGAGGYGGAMGPAQFIASTWKLIAPRIAKTLGISNTNPWDPEQAIMASAYYLGDLGAVAGSYTSEMRAACKYYGTGGTSCTYGKSVQKYKAQIQSNIDVLNN